jgi:hypothetical protein
LENSLERAAGCAHSLPMNDTPHPGDATAAEWAAILAESEAEAEAGLFVPADEIMREPHESIARMEGRTEAPDHAHGAPDSPLRR